MTQDDPKKLNRRAVLNTFLYGGAGGLTLYNLLRDNKPPVILFTSPIDGALHPDGLIQRTIDLSARDAANFDEIIISPHALALRTGNQALETQIDYDQYGDKAKGLSVRVILPESVPPRVFPVSIINDKNSGKIVSVTLVAPFAMRQQDPKRRVRFAVHAGKAQGDTYIDCVDSRIDLVMGGIEKALIRKGIAAHIDQWDPLYRPYTKMRNVTIQLPNEKALYDSLFFVDENGMWYSNTRPEDIPPAPREMPQKAEPEKPAAPLRRVPGDARITGFFSRQSRARS